MYFNALVILHICTGCHQSTIASDDIIII